MSAASTIHMRGTPSAPSNGTCHPFRAVDIAASRYMAPISGVLCRAARAQTCRYGALGSAHL